MVIPGSVLQSLVSDATYVRKSMPHTCTLLHTAVNHSNVTQEPHFDYQQAELHLRRRLRHFFEFMCKVTYLCYFFKILCYFSKILFYFFEILCYFFPNLFGLNKNLFHLSNNYVITPIIMCVRDNICWPTSHRNSLKAKLCCSAAILCCFHHIMNERVANSDTLIIFSSPTYHFDLNWQRKTHARGRFTL